MSKRGFDGATVDRGGSIGTGGGFEEAPGGGEKLALPVVRGLPLLLLPHHVEIIWQAHDIETATARAATGAHLREGSQKTGASVATAATLADREASYSGVAASADAKTGQNPTDSAPGQKHTIGLHGATGQVQRSTAGGSTSGKKSSVNSSHTRDSVAKGGKDGCSASGGSKLQGSTPAGGVAGPAGVCRNGKLRPGSLVTTQNSEADRAMVRDAGIRSCVEETCRILRLGPEGRRKQAVVDFHLFSLLFAREARLCSAKAAIFVSIMGVTLSQIETVAKAVSFQAVSNSRRTTNEAFAKVHGRRL
ncbi:hypothetical protein TGME49_255490 [Toxoplasma gondii ME49]|uniref:Uncharacterized protein n=4 Tax=Toxoplasma gondii TaxID=5811 RepID=B6KAP3_TOXGV|nr:hypothetical protein TGME49_255490 [Toxoplasma gondii ME49]EPT29162.1 hypothetical protein TGME49_255490 [Toxoplasma gondii ME49]ESS35505.1 hypothetical protein TGVEG_255490 [Toxoplasma gondii VEG]KYF45834.1 hypothetical protein TGARI_255490 [Toxoplasma gondii ARI]|eukprot:XP_002364877.1 hypothetical protein TGME49_255490 [Toxoplasma gondii ME49]